MQNEKEIIARIKFLMKEMNIRQTKMAKMIDVDTSNLSKYMNNRIPISESFLNKIVVNLGVSKRWLVTGQDLPFGKESTPSQIDINQGSISTIRRGAPVYDVDVTAGDVARDKMFADERITGWINLPQLNPQCRVVRVSGDSMTPIIHDGDYVAVRELTNNRQIFWGQIYVVLLENFRLIKYVRRHSDPNMVILRSANKDYDDMEVRRDEILELMPVQHIIHFSTRM